MNSLALGALAVAGAVAQHGYGGSPAQSPEPNVNTATGPAAVHAAQATAATNTKDTSNVCGKAFDRFVTIWFENTDYTKAAGDPNFAYLASQGITLENYFGVTHPSEPNYAASVGGDNFGMDNDNFNQVASNVSTVVDLLEDAGISWGTYQEDMPYTGFEGYSWVNQNTSANDYVRKHHPTILYNANTTPDRLAKQKNFTEFKQDLANKELPQWMFITPNMTDDAHDTSVTTAGLFLKRFLFPLLNNTYFMENTLILITFDENHTYTIGNRVFSILLGGAVNGKKGTSDSSFYNHYSEISSVEANWDLHTLGRWDVGANVFKVVGDQTGDSIRPYTAVTGSNETVFLNSSYAGPFNVDVQPLQNKSYPAPNVNLKSSGKDKRTVLPAIKQTWQGDGSTIYSDTVEIPDGQHPPKGYVVNSIDK